jgi:Recombinase
MSTPLDVHLTSRPAIRAASWLRASIPHVYFCVKRIIRFGRVYAKWVLAVANLKGIVDDLRSQGIKSIRTITAELNARGILTPRAGAWHPTSVARLLARLSA